MKKVLFVAIGLSVLTNSAYASKARQSALQNSFLLTDTRDILVNPADLNIMKNFVITEWGASTQGASPNAEGGFFKDAGRFAYGLYLGDDNTNAHNTVRTNAHLLEKDNVMSFFFAGDMGIQWGARVDYATSKNEVTDRQEQSSLGFSLGTNWKDLKVSANIDLKDVSKSATSTAATKYEEKFGYDIQAHYGIMGFDLFGQYKKHGYDLTNSGAKEYKLSLWAVGIGKVHEVAKTARLFTDLKWSSSKEEDKTVTTPTETKENILKVTVGYEADATSWLVLRGAFSQQMMGYQKNINGKKTTNTNTTDVSAGATFNFGQLKVDGMIGTDSTGQNTSTTEGGNLRTDNLMTTVAVHYWF